VISDTTLIILLCGAGTFLLRFLPIWQTRRAVATAHSSKRVQRLLQGIGPAAIMALLIISLWPTLVTDFHLAKAISALVALMLIAVLKRARGGIALPTLGGALGYGILMQILSP
jgi:branched-subunit amino acid transport protein AzlD